MATAARHVRVSRRIKARPEAVYRAFTNDVAFREWLYDGAWAQGREGGKLFLNWKADVLAELKHGQAETVAFIREMPTEFVSGIANYVHFGQAMLQGAYHPRLHYDPIRAVLGTLHGQT